MKVTICTTGIDFDGDMEEHPSYSYKWALFESDAMTMPIEEFKIKWKITELRKLGKSYCRAGYTDRLHPEKSWWGHNPETLAKLQAYMDSLDKEVEDGSKPK